MNAKEISQLNNAKDRARTFWNAACVEADVPLDSKFVVFDYTLPAAKACNEAALELVKVRARIQKNELRRARHEAAISCGLVRVRVNGKTFYE